MQNYPHRLALRVGLLSAHHFSSRPV